MNAEKSLICSKLSRAGGTTETPPAYAASYNNELLSLFLFFKWEGRKREFRVATPKEIVLYSVAPTIIWALLGSLFAPNPFLILTTTASLCLGVSGVDAVVDLTFFQPFPYALLFAVFYSAAIFGGYMYGRRFNDL